MAASLRFLAQNDLELLDRFQFDVLPCLNPFGFIRNFVITEKTSMVLILIVRLTIYPQSKPK